MGLPESSPTLLGLKRKIAKRSQESLERGSEGNAVAVEDEEDDDARQGSGPLSSGTGVSAPG